MSLDFNNEIVLDCGETTTYAHRWVRWMPAVGEEAGELGPIEYGVRCARMEIALDKHGGGKSTMDAYHAWEMPPLPNLAGVVYRLMKTEGHKGDPYITTIGSINQCTCEAGRHAPKSEGSLGCKHRDALAAIVAQLRAMHAPVAEMVMPFEPPH